MTKLDVMRLIDFDVSMKNACDIRRHAEWMLIVANKVESDAMRSANITETDREPGFKRFKIKGLEDQMPYCETPRDALEWAHNNLPDEN